MLYMLSPSPAFLMSIGGILVLLLTRRAECHGLCPRVATAFEMCRARFFTEGMK